jgi:predicted MFS family arabinose efflux permease
MSEAGTSEGRALQAWMISNFAAGAALSAFMPLLVPAYITELTGEAGTAGIVMAIISLAAVIGPLVGSFADNHRAHRLLLTAGLVTIGAGFLGFGLAASNGYFAMLDAILIGVGAAAVSTLVPIFVISAGLSDELEARRLTYLFVLFPLGQMVGGGLLGAVQNAGASFEQGFLLAAGFMGLAAILTWFTTRKPAARIQLSDGESTETVPAEDSETGIGRILRSSFGVLFAITILTAVANNGVNNQISNIMPQVYGFDATTTSALISLAGLLNLGLFFIAGRWMARSGPFPVYTAGAVLRFVGVGGMALVGTMGPGGAMVLAALSMQLLYQGNPFVRLAQTPLAVRFAPMSPSAASGWVLGGSALGSFIGSLLGGFLADTFGFNAINWMAVVGAALSVALLLFVLRRAEREKQAEQERAEQIGHGAGHPV